MNKQEKLIALLLGLALVGWVFYSIRVDRARMRQMPPPVATSSVGTNAPALPAQTVLNAPAALPAPAPAPVLVKPSSPEQVVSLSNDCVTASFSSWGAVVRAVTLNRYAMNPGVISEKNPAVVLGNSSDPCLALDGLVGLPVNASYAVSRDGSNALVFATSAGGLSVTRRIELLPEYQLSVKDTFKNTGKELIRLGTNTLCLGSLMRGSSKNDLLSVDSLPVGDKDKVKYWGSDKVTSKLLVGNSGSGFGCGGAPSAIGMPAKVSVPVSQPQQWLALKSRFFLTALQTPTPNAGFSLIATRDMTKPTYYLDSVSASLLFPEKTLGQGETEIRTYRLFIGPKKLSLLQKFGGKLDDVMEFGMWSWVCKLLLPTLNGFYWAIPNYGIAILLLTLLVRIIFWPLTHKSTEGMKKMQEIQPKIKEIQKKFKDNPQKLQQETWAVYRDNKVNPLSSCLPMLIQIPVFIALFYVLRNSVELRYAPFLWIADLSEPENLLANVLPIPLNILPVLMAATMALQSYLTPSTGDPQQQRMMMVMMPAMMLFMFYSFPSALSLYWTVSQVLAIVQMLMIQRKGKKNAPASPSPDSPMTRQQRRHTA